MHRITLINKPVNYLVQSNIKSSSTEPVQNSQRRKFNLEHSHICIRILH